MAKKKEQSKKNGKKKPKDILNGADNKHLIDTEKYVKMVDKLYQQAIADLSALASKIEGIPEDKPFSFDQNKAIAAEVEKTIKNLADRITAVVDSGSRAEWNAACVKGDAFIASIMNVSKLTKHTLQTYQDRNLEALNAFTKREVEGLNLSKRVWKHVAPIKDEVEIAVDTTQKYYKNGINSSKNLTKMERSIGTGMSAAELSREVRSCLLEPNKLFRRVRDKYGNLTLSKAAQLYHPGQGVYRSSYKNAMRLARTEINMAYRQSDHMRWQQLDFVVGMKVELSNNHTTKDPKSKGTIPLVDICDKLAGKYPKDFKFVGWHPQCRCHVTPILKPLEEITEGTADSEGNWNSLPSASEVKDVPEAFNDYIAANEERMKGWKSTPYYIKDNPQYVDKALHPEKYAVNPLVLDAETLKKLTDFEMYGFNHQGSKKFNAALDAAKIAIQKGQQKAFDDAMKEMEAIMKKNEASKASKAKNKEKEGVSAEKMLADDLATFTDAQKKNIEELEKALKQKRGLKMTHEQANTGKENPNFEFKGSIFERDENGRIIYEKKGNKWKAKYTKEYEDNKQYHVNCQTCTVIHELRRRGFNVEAVGNKRGSVWRVYKKNGVGSSQEGYRTGKWLDQDGKPVGYTYAHEYAAGKKMTITNKDQVSAFFEDFSGGKDGRFEICVDWKGGSAHVFCAERKDGKWVFFDPQSGKENVFDGYAAKAKLHKFGIIRTDDKLINPKLAETFIPKGELPIVAETAPKKTRAEEIAEIAKKRHDARTDEQKKKLQEFWEKRKEESKMLREDISQTVKDARGIEDAAESVKHMEELSSGKASMEKLRKAAQDIKKVTEEYNNAINDAKSIVGELKGIKDVDTDAVLKEKSINGVKEGTKKLESIKNEIEGLSQLDDPIAVARKYSLSEAKSVNAAIEKTFARWTWNLDTEASLSFLQGRLKREIDLVVSQKKYSTWEVARDAFQKRLDIVNKRIEMNAVKSSIVGAISILKSTRSSVSKKLVDEFDALFADKNIDISILKQKAKTLQAKADQIEKKRLEKTMSTSVGGSMSEAEARQRAKDYFLSVCGKKYDDSELVFENGFLKLSSEQHALINKHGMKLLSGERKKVWSHNDGGYIRTSNSFTINGAIRDVNGGGKNAIFGDIRKADTTKCADMYGSKLTNDDVITIETLDNIIGRNSLPFPITVVRNLNLDGINPIFFDPGGSTKFDPKKSIADQINAMATKSMRSDPAFMSVSSDASHNVFTTRLYQLRIRMNAGTHVYVTDNAPESECVLGRNTKLQLISVKEGKTKYGSTLTIIECQVI